MAYLFNGLHEELSLNLTEKQEKSATKQIDYSNPDEYLSASLNSSFSKISELFQGLFSSEIRCPQCSHSSTQYDEFNVVSLPLYNKEDQYNIQINYIPKDISQNFETKNYKFSNSQELTLKDLLEIIKKDLQLPNEIPLLTAIVEDDKIQELIKENTILVKELKTRLELKRKKFIVYEMPVDWDATFDNLIYVCFSTEIKKSGITFKKLVGTPRVIVTKPQANYEDLYVSIMDLFKVVYPDQIIQFNEIKENLNLVQKNLEILHENNNNIDNNNGLVENHLSNMRSEINLSISQNKTKISKTQSSSENNETHLKKEIISEKSPNKRIEVEKTTESQIKDAATVIESTKTGQPPSRGKKNKKAPRVSKRKKTEKKNEIASINEEEPKIFEPSSEISSQKIQIKDQMDSDPETLLQDFILCLPYYVKFVNKMKNIHACLLCHKKNCDSCALTLTNPLSLIELLNICQTNQIQMEINIFFPNEVPKVIEQTLEVTTHSSSSATVNSNPSILQCLDIFSEKEVLSSENMWFCPVCDEKKQAEKTMKLCYVSQYLVFHLKRFKSVEGSGSSKNSKKVKNNQPIDYPINDLDMTSYVKDLVPHMRTANSKVFKYRLIAVVLHEGKLDEGHYMSLGRCRDGVWRKFDDERVQEIQEKEVCHKNAYLLFYELCK